MESFFKKLKHLVPKRVGIRFNTIAGSNTCFDPLHLFGDFLSRKKRIKANVEFEMKFSQISGSKFSYAYGSGRMALYAILEAMEIGKDDEVIIPAFTCVVVSNAILYRGAKPIYVDIDPSTFNIDVSKVEKKISDKTRALYAQHTFGLPCDMEKLNQLCKARGLYLIEDSAHCLEAKSVGGKSKADASFFSTDHSKIINTYSGGIASTDNSDIAFKLQKIQENSHELSRLQKMKLLFSFLIESFLFAPYILWMGEVIFKILNKFGFIFNFSDQLKTSLPSSYPFPCKFSNFQALIGLRQLNKLADNLDHRKEIVNFLSKNIAWSEIYGVSVKEIPLLRYSFLVQDRKAFEEKFSKYFDLQIWFTSVVHMRNSDLEKVYYFKGSCPQAEFVTDHIVNFPTHPRINKNIMFREVEKNLDWINTQIISAPKEDV